MKTHNSHQQSNRRAELDVLIASWPFCTESVTMRSQRTLVRLLYASPYSAQTGSSVNRVKTSAPYSIHNWQSQSLIEYFWHKTLLLPVLLLHRITNTAQSAARQRLALYSNAEILPNFFKMANT